MSELDVARWQFAITTLYHFLFVPLTIGLSFFVAALQTAWFRTRDPKWYRLTKFFGELFLINFALGVVTGIVQEFQFGMNWSSYSRFVGDIFGAPLAIEGLLAFFLESTFLGLWIFGWDRLSRGVHLATIWIVAFGTAISAYIILAANSWMQHPVGYVVNPVTGRAELTDFLAVVFNNTAVITFLHTIPAAFLTTGGLVAAVAMWRLVRRHDEDAPIHRGMIKAGSWMVIVAAVLVVVTGDYQARLMTQQQPMKMAAAEALYETQSGASLSIFTIGSLDGHEELFSIRIPYLLSFMATGDPNGTVEGINDLQAQYQELYGPGNYRPYTPVTYWGFRLMIGFGVLAGLAAAWFLWATRRGRMPGRFAVTAAVALPFLPLLANSVGWVFTEVGRQPWIVFGLQKTADGVTPGAPLFEVLLTMLGFTVLYGALAIVEAGLLTRRIRAGLPPAEEAPGFQHEPESEPVLALGY
jgi:cytochrome d ubiquinol oxidase subunit I